MWYICIDRNFIFSLYFVKWAQSGRKSFLSLVRGELGQQDGLLSVGSSAHRKRVWRWGEKKCVSNLEKD